MRTDESRERGTQLHEQGWTRRFSALGRRLDEAVELYSQLGFEILLEPAELDEEFGPRAGECESCIVTTLARTIYTRPCRSVNADEQS
jgi:hypothetical protein